MTEELCSCVTDCPVTTAAGGQAKAVACVNGKGVVFVYCNIMTNRSRLVMCDAHSSLDLMFTTQCDMMLRGDVWKGPMRDSILDLLKGPM